MHAPHCPCTAHAPLGDIERRVQAKIEANRTRLRQMTAAPDRSTSSSDLAILERLAANSGIALS